MKIVFTVRLLLVLLPAICIHVICTAQSWQPLGPDDFNQPSYNEADFTSIAVDGNGTPYVVFEDNNGVNHGKATVMKYDGATWVPVGKTGFSAGPANYTRIAVGGNGTPYIVFSDWANGGAATVMMFNGANWVIVGSAGFSAGQVNYTSIAINSNGVPYVAYQDIANHNAATVMRYNGARWVTVGAAGFSAGPAAYTDIAVNSSGTPYVVYADGNVAAGNAAANGAVVMKFNGSNWVAVGNAGFSAGAAQYTRIALNANGKPYVVYEDGGNSNKSTVMAYNNTGWIAVGKAGFSKGAATYTAIAVDGSGVPYVIYNDFGNDFNLTLTKFDGANWVPLAQGHQARWMGVAITGTGLLYAAYTDDNNRNGGQSKATVIRWDGTNFVTVGETGFSAGESIDNTSIVMDGSGTPFVAYADYNESTGAKANVKKYVGGGWAPVGNIDFSAGIAMGIRLALGPAGIPYVVYQDDIADGNHQLKVMKLNDGIWAQVGAALSTLGVMYQCIAVNSSGVPYVAYQDAENGYGITVKKFDGTNWITVGTPGFSTGGYLIDYINLVIDGSGTPYVVFEDGEPAFSLTSGVSVMKFDGTGWVAVGSPDFSPGTATNTNIAFNSHGTPYVVYSDAANGYKATVMQYTAIGKTGWSAVGTPGFSQEIAFYDKITFDINDVPYVIYQNGSFGQAAVMRYIDGEWAAAGSQTLSAGYANYTDMAIAPGGMAVAVYENGGAFARTIDITTLPLKLGGFTAQLTGKIVSVNWNTLQEINTSHFNVQRSADGRHFNTIGTVQAAGNSSLPENYAYTDATFASLGVSQWYYRLQEVDKDSKNYYSRVAVVHLYAGNKPAFVVTPNPSKAAVALQFRYFSSDVNIKVTDMNGRVLLNRVQNVIEGSSVPLPVDNMAAGVYIVTAECQGVLLQEKFVKQ